MRPPVLAISREEFARCFQRAKPPPGWPSRIAVANSGGPDSTCLLFLIHRFLAHLPLDLRLSSITVDHALQPDSAAMADRAAATAASLRVPHSISRITWGTAPFPPLPDSSRPFEAVARGARYNLLWKQMQRDDVGVLATAHHNDDQIETALIRFGKQSSELGARGILTCRRWGMGQKNDLEWVGIEGMNKWIIRPLLDFSKDRILATCEENNLTYVTDPTNFQPDITLRNALRAVLSKDKETPLDRTTLPPDIQENLQAIDKTISSFPNLSINLDSSPEQLRMAVKTIDSFASDIESRATMLLQHCRIASPHGTFVLASRPLQIVTNPLLRRAMILRILRYVSFQPWGSLRAQAGRSRHTIDSIIENVWNPSPFTSRETRPFASGAGVLWRPVVVDVLRATANSIGFSGRIKTPNVKHLLSGRAKLGRGVVGWMAVRQPPFPPEKMAAFGLDDSVNLDITATLRDGLIAWDNGSGTGPQTIEILWDCRFLLRFDLALMPSDLVEKLTIHQPPRQVAIRWWTNYYYPKVVLVAHNGQTAWSEKEDPEVVLHSDVIGMDINPLQLINKPKKPVNKEPHSVRANTPLLACDWITSQWIRILDPF